MKKRPPRIPIPWSVRWSQFRQNVAPGLAFLIVLAVVVLRWGEATTGTFPGLAEAAYSQVSAPQNAVLDRLLVEPFARVEAGTGPSVRSTRVGGVRLQRYRIRREQLLEMFGEVESDASVAIADRLDSDPDDLAGGSDGRPCGRGAAASQS